MAINFNIKATNMDLTPSLTDYIHEKLGSLEKYINLEGDKEVKAQVEIGLRSKHHKKGDVYRAEINLECSGKKYRAVTKKDDMFAAIDELKDEITRIVRRSKNKKSDLFIRGARKIKSMLKRKG